MTPSTSPQTSPHRESSPVVSTAAASVADASDVTAGDVATDDTGTQAARESAADPRPHKGRRHPILTATLALIVVAALVVAAILIVPRLRHLHADADVQGTYTVRMADSDGPLARAVLSKGSIAIDFPGHEGKITATLSKTAGPDDGVSFIASDITMTGDTAANLLAAMPSLGISASQLKVILGSAQPTITLPESQGDGSPVGTWKISLSVLGVGVSASAVFHDDKTLTTTENFPGGGKSFSLTWSSPSPGTVTIMGKNGKAIEVITIPHH
ncbi:MAG: hypothetical protein LKF35_01935 [Bifidobacterium minimum]|nr:hypothetical protein [Bifidobacterium minimum]